MSLPIFQRTIVDSSGNIQPGASVAVRNETTGDLVTIYADREGGTAKANPFLAASEGFATFYVEPGEYQVTATTPAGTITWSHVDIGDTALLQLAQPTGDTLVGSDDGAGGSLWTTVAGFIARLRSSTGAALVGFVQAGTGAVQRTLQDKARETVSVKDYGAVEGFDVGPAVNAALAHGHKKIKMAGNYTLETQILLQNKTGVELDLTESNITAGNGLNETMIRLIDSTSCTVLPGVLDGNAAGQTLSSFGIDLNGGSKNKVKGGRVTNCKTYGVYNIYCQYAEVSGIEVDNCQQAGIAGDVGPGDCVGFRVKNVTVHNNGLGGVGATSGLYLEGTPGTNHWFKDLEISGVIAYGNRGAGVGGQGWKSYSLNSVKARDNYAQGIALFACFNGTGGDFHLENNDVGAVPGYGNAVSVDDTGVTPASEFNTFSKIYSSGHGGYAVLERGTANNNSFLDVDSVSDGAVFSLAGPSSVATKRNEINGALRINGSVLASSASSSIGYASGAGGTVTQTTSKSTGVTLNRPTGRILMHGESMPASGLVEFVLTNSAILSTDLLVFNVVSGATQAAYEINCRPSNGSAVVEVRNRTAGALAESLVIAFCVIKGAVS